MDNQRKLLDFFFSLNIDFGVAIRNFRCKKTSKEIIESIATVSLLKDHLGKHSDRKLVFFVVGDGKYPKTGFLLSYIFKDSVVYSIDPLIDESCTEKNLKCMRCFDYQVDFPLLAKDCLPVIVAVHSHGDFRMVFESFEECIGITIPCCCKRRQLLYDGDLEKNKRDENRTFIPVFDRIQHKHLIAKGKIGGLTESVSNASNAYFLYEKIRTV